ncbi:hypothetical protein PFISCL1PPCAC_1465, partial [Pristionchus fissidentatus]
NLLSRAAATSLPMTDDDSRDDIPAPTPDDFAEELPPLEGQVIATPEATYVLRSDMRKDEICNFYDAFMRIDQVNDTTHFRIEFEKVEGESCVMSKRMEMEATIRSVLLNGQSPASTNHIHVCDDLGAHSPWKFIVMPNYHLAVPKFLSEADTEDKTKALFLRIAMNSFRGIETLHRIGIIHGNIRPENFYIGTCMNGRKVAVANFQHATSVNREIPKGAELIDMTYASRGRMRSYEACKKDDLESWLYCVAEFYHKELVPWVSDTKPTTSAEIASQARDIIKLKRAFCGRRMWKASKEVLFPEFDQILQLMLKTSGTSDPPYSQIWDCLASAGVYMECAPFGLAPWMKTNNGAPTMASAFTCSPVPDVVEDYGSK